MKNNDIHVLYERICDNIRNGGAELEDALEKIAKFIPVELFNEVTLTIYNTLSETEYFGFEAGVEAARGDPAT